MAKRTYYAEAMEDWIRFDDVEVPPEKIIKDFTQLKTFIDNRIKYWTLRKATSTGHVGRMKANHYIGAYQTLRKMTFDETYKPTVTVAELEEVMSKRRTKSDYDRLLRELRKSTPTLVGRRRKKDIKEKDKELQGLVR
jgi:hypothetical protein